MKKYSPGTAVYIKTTLRDKTGALYDPTSIVITVYDPSMTPKITDQAMNKISTGVYDYTYQSAETDAVGNHFVKVKAVSGTYTSIGKVQLFTLGNP